MTVQARPYTTRPWVTSDGLHRGAFRTLKRKLEPRRLGLGHHLESAIAVCPERFSDQAARPYSDPGHQ